MSKSEVSESAVLSRMNSISSSFTSFLNVFCAITVSVCSRPTSHRECVTHFGARQRACEPPASCASGTKEPSEAQEEEEGTHLKVTRFIHFYFPSPCSLQLWFSIGGSGPEVTLANKYLCCCCCWFCRFSFDRVF